MSAEFEMMAGITEAINAGFIDMDTELTSIRETIERRMPTLRDYFAVNASDDDITQARNDKFDISRVQARYLHADAMLAESEKVKSPQKQEIDDLLAWKASAIPLLTAWHDVGEILGGAKIGDSIVEVATRQAKSLKASHARLLATCDRMRELLNAAEIGAVTPKEAFEYRKEPERSAFHSGLVAGIKLALHCLPLDASGKEV